VIELRSFGGLSVEETASVLKVSMDTVMRDWKLAKAWLLRELRDRDGAKKVRREREARE
jgi:RNA polymerase sigma-70 factor (ECF subfamily)